MDERKTAFYRHNQKGIALILSLMFLGILALLGSTAVVLTTTDMKIGDNYKNNTRALSAAQAAIAEARFRLHGSSSASGYAGDTGAGFNPWWSAYILTSGSWSTGDDPDYDGNYQNYFPSGTNFTSTTASVNTLQSTVNVDYFVKIRHKREYDAEEDGHTTTTPHYSDNDGNLGTNPLSAPGSSIYYGDDPTTASDKEWIEFTHGAPGDARPVEIIRAYGQSNGSLAVVEVEVRQMPLNIDVEAAVYTKGDLTGNGTSLLIDGYDNAGSGGTLSGCTADAGVQPYYLYDDPTVAGSPVATLNGLDEDDGTDELTGNPDDPAQRIGGVDMPIDKYVEAMGFPGTADHVITADVMNAVYGADGDGNSVVCYSDTSDPTNVGGLKLNNVTGYGILAVKGDLEMGGGFVWHGLVLVTGTLRFNGGGSGVNIFGAVLAEQTVTINGGVDIKYDSCYIKEALAAKVARISRWARVY